MDSLWRAGMESILCSPQCRPKTHSRNTTLFIIISTTTTTTVDFQQQQQQPSSSQQQQLQSPSNAIAAHSHATAATAASTTTTWSSILLSIAGFNTKRFDTCGHFYYYEYYYSPFSTSKYRTNDVSTIQVGCVRCLLPASTCWRRSRRNGL